MKSINIKGKEYVEVNERIKYFRDNFKGFSIVTDLLSNDNGVCIIKATIQDEVGRVLATGHAYEKEGSTFINKTSYIENCETSAIGRALGIFGIGIDSSIDSYEKVSTVIANQNKKKEIEYLIFLSQFESSYPVEMVGLINNAIANNSITDQQLQKIEAGFQKYNPNFYVSFDNYFSGKVVKK